MVCAPVLLGPRAYEERSRSSGTHLRLGFLRISLSVLLHAEAGALGGAFAVRSGAAACRFVFKRGAAGLLTIAGHGAFYLDFRLAASAGAVVDAAFYCTF